MKKFLSMVLALVMAMSLVTISAGAADFTDADSIDYAEAVEVMTAVGVVDGYTDGSFGPDGYLTRGAAAKIICNLILGPTTAEALVADAAPYSDVPTSNVFAGYIAYCQKEGIISGYADGTFRPGNSLTGYAFMKMLLGALGYEAEQEGYTGNNWSINVAKQAINLGLEDGLEGDFVGVNTVTRQEALLYAFNAMQATMVEYPNNSTIKVGDITVSTNSTASKITVADTVAGYDNSYDEELQFCEQYFSKLKAYPAEDDYGRPATTWKWKSEEIGTYGKKADLVYTVAPSLYALRKDLGLKTTDASTSFKVTWSVNMSAWSSSKWNEYAEVVYALPKATSSDATTLGEVFATEEASAWSAAQAYADTYFGGDVDAAYAYYINKGTYSYMDYYPVYGKGQQIEVFYDAEKSANGDYSKNEIVIIDETFGKITSVKTDDNGRYVTVNTAPNSTSKFYTDDFAKGDFVVYTTGINADYDIVTMAASEKISGTVNYINGATYMVIDGTGYYCHAADWVTAYGVTAGDEVDVWFDSYGYIANIVVTDSNSDPSKLLIVTKKASTADLLDNYDAIVVYGDGTEEVVTLKDAAATNLDTIYSYTMTNGKLKVSAPSGFSQVVGATNFSYTKGNPVFGGIKVDDNTNFVYIDDVGSVTGIKTYVGYKNAPSIEENAATKAIALKKNDATAATLVYVWADSEKLSSTAAEYTIVIPDTYYLWTTTDDDGVTQKYYALRTLANTYLYVDALNGSVYDDDVAPVKNTAAAVVYDTIVYNTDNGYVDDASNSEADRVIAGTAGVNTVKYKNGVLYVNGTGYALADGAECYVVAYNGDSFYTDEITGLDGEYLNYTIILDDELSDGGEIQTLVLREVKG